MSKEIIYTPKAPEPIGPYSQAVKVGNQLFVSGQIAIDVKTGNLVLNTIEEETELVMKNLGEILEAAGFGFTDVVKTSIFLSNMDFFPVVNEIYGKFFSINPPARETVAVKTLPKNVNVEISVIAIKD